MRNGSICRIECVVSYAIIILFLIIFHELERFVHFHLVLFSIITNIGYLCHSYFTRQKNRLVSIRSISLIEIILSYTNFHNQQQGCRLLMKYIVINFSENDAAKFFHNYEFSRSDCILKKLLKLA